MHPGGWPNVTEAARVFDVARHTLSRVRRQATYDLAQARKREHRIRSFGASPRHRLRCRSWSFQCACSLCSIGAPPTAGAGESKVWLT